MFKFKNGISPVIAVILLLAITVVISMSMYSFLQDYTENTTSLLSSTSFNQIKVIGVYGDNLYLDSNENELFSLFQVKNLSGNVQCEIRDSIQSTFQGDTRLLMTFDSDTVNSTHVRDLSGYNNHGLINGSTYMEDNCISGGCFEFDGINDYIKINSEDSSLILTSNNSFTLQIWFRTDNISKQQVLLRKSGSVASSGYGFIISENLSASTFQIIDTTGLVALQENHHNLRSNIQLNQEYFHLIGTYEKNLMKFYINGEFNSEYKLNQSLISSSDFLSLGAIFRNNNSTGQFFDGTMDEVAIYSKALNDDEISKLYNLKSAKFYEQLLSTQTKEVNLSNCNLNKNSKYEFIGISESGSKISETFVVN